MIPILMKHHKENHETILDDGNNLSMLLGRDEKWVTLKRAWSSKERSADLEIRQATIPVRWNHYQTAEVDWR